MEANGTPGSPMGPTEPKLATTEYPQPPVFESTKMAPRWHWALGSHGRGFIGCVGSQRLEQSQGLMLAKAQGPMALGNRDLAAQGGILGTSGLVASWP
eukprot:589210-Pyramimonas_sp.AAC.2